MGGWVSWLEDALVISQQLRALYILLDVKP